jgi:hypothetical protein
MSYAQMLWKPIIRLKGLFTNTFGSIGVSGRSNIINGSMLFMMGVSDI